LTPVLWILVALLASGAVLVGVELAKGALDPPAPKIADPCKPREGRTGGIDATIQRVVLDGLDGAACRLHTSREELVLSLGSGTGVTRHWNEHTLEVALRAGLIRSVDEAERRGDIPSFLAPAIRELIRRTPLKQLIQGGFKLSDLLGSAAQRPNALRIDRA
jgi:hypothetical protein